ncbi:MAG: endo-1,4-beta-xylanase [Oscillospiraceae bacterium]|nr:endo-1,4-beta-xylanase [Oscillospiraceae bacterium]
MKTKKRRGKLLSAVLSLVMGVSMLPHAALTSLAAPGQVLSVGNGQNQHKGESDGFSYEIWLDNTGGSGTMTLGQGATFKAEWSASVPSGNFLARRGLDFGSQKRATDYPYIGMDYVADYRQTGSANGNSRLCVYGWFQNKGLAGVPLVEYYIIEDWVDWCPDGQGTMVTIDGAQYKIFKNQHSGPSINSGHETFWQYFSVRQDKRKSGHITVSDHFAAWAAQGWEIGNLYEVALNAEGWQSSGVADITKLNVYTDPSKADENYTPEPTDPPEAPEPGADGYYFHSTFESGSDSWGARGDNSVATDGSSYAAGSKSLYVTNRAEAWNGAGYTLDTDTFVPGVSYSFSTMVMQNAASSDTFKLSLEYSLNGQKNYDTIAEGTASKGEWAQLANTSYQIPAGATDLLLYVETDTSLNSFYMDEAFAAPEGTKIPAATGGTTGEPEEEETTNPPSTPSSDSLKDAFSSCFRLGTSVSPHELSSGASFIKKHFNSITPENELKPDALIDQQACQQRGNNVNTQISLNRAAQTLKFCEDNNIGVRGHTFVWYSQTPDWFFKENFSSNGAYVSKEVMNQRLESFIKNTFEAIATQYPKLDLYAYDVCNELFLNDGGGLRQPGGPPGSHWAAVYGANNDEFIINAFTYARKYAPKGCKLYINDYNEYIPAKTNDIYNIAMKLKGLGVIDGIGMQSHLATNYPDANTYKTALEKFISTGLDVQITELDITCSDFSAQAKLYKDIFQMAVDNRDKISCLTVWGTMDPISWRKDQNPLLFSANYQPKPAYDAVMEVAATIKPIETETTPAETTKPKETTTTTTTTPITTTTTEDNGGNVETATKYGDVNCDGSVDILDVISLNKNLLGAMTLTKEGQKNADVNNDGSTSSADSLLIMKFVIKLVDKLPA